MAAATIADLDAPERIPSLLHSIDPNSMIFLHRGQTRLQLAKALSTVVYAPLPHSSRIWLVASEFEVILTFLVCAIMLYKKRALGHFWIFTKRTSQNGSFVVSNAVFTLVLGVASYLFAWDSLAMIISSFSFANISTMQWWCVIPLPWLPLVVSAYISIHGFTVGCSPRSPLSVINSHAGTAHKRWYYVPIGKSPIILNTLLVLPCVLFTISSIALVAMSCNTFFRAKAFAHHHLSPDLLHQMQDSAAGHPTSLPNPDDLASDELVWLARNVAARYMDVHRYVCINLAIFAAAAISIFIPCIGYGIPNVVHLVDHACSRYPQPLPASCKSFPRKLGFLVTKGKPVSSHSTTHLNLGSWKMTILAVIYVSILVVCVPLFGFIPIFIICDTFPHRVQTGNLVPPILHAVLAASIITILSCTFVALFCCVSTLDPLFRAAIGLNMLRTHVPIDIHVEVHQSRAEEHDLTLSPTFVSKDPTMQASRKTSLKIKTLTTMPSNSTLSSMSKPSTLSGSSDQTFKG